MKREQMEGEIAELQKQVSAFPRELEAAVNKAVKEATERIIKETTAKEQLLRKEFEGERKVFISRIEALEKNRGCAGRAGCKTLSSKNRTRRSRILQ